MNYAVIRNRGTSFIPTHFLNFSYICGVSTHPPISEELALFIESGLSVHVATRNRALVPEGSIGWAARVHPDREHITVYLQEEAVKPLLKNLKQHTEIAVLLELPSTHRACQVKGTFVRSRKAPVSTKRIIAGQLDSFRADLESFGVPRIMNELWEFWPAVELEVRVLQLFEQTPGPGAGEPLK